MLTKTLTKAFAGQGRPMSDSVQLPWIDEPVELSEAVELMAQADEDDQDQLEDLQERIERLESQMEMLVDPASVSCPSCEEDDEVFTAGVGAARLANDGSLSKKNARAINNETHVCLSCGESFTPPLE